MKNLIIQGVVFAIVLVGLTELCKFSSTLGPPSNADTFRQDFIEECVIEGYSMEFCDCSYDKLSHKYGYEGMVDMGKRELSGEGMTEEENETFYEIAKSCGYLL
jgi:hypothetical protein